jgi:hypothetical protein
VGDFFGLPTRTLRSAELEIEVLESAGPRIVGLRYKDSANLLGAVPQISIPTPYGAFRYLGGHRLWHAPEAMPRSYIPDEDGLSITEIPHGLVLEGPVEVATGLQKRIELRLDPERPSIDLRHSLTNHGLWEVELAPWTITMFRLGGTVILPLREAQVNPEGLLPDRRVSLWPYSHLDDPRLRLIDEAILVEARPEMPLFKVGAYDPQGWIAYWLDGLLFCKSFAAVAGADYPDDGCNAETYCDSDFVELESLGPLARLAPGQSLVHAETWELYESLEQEFMPESVVKLLLP